MKALKSAALNTALNTALLATALLTTMNTANATPIFTDDFDVVQGIAHDSTPDGIPYSVAPATLRNGVTRTLGTNLTAGSPPLTNASQVTNGYFAVSTGVGETVVTNLAWQFPAGFFTHLTNPSVTINTLAIDTPFTSFTLYVNGDFIENKTFTGGSVGLSTTFNLTNSMLGALNNGELQFSVGGAPGFDLVWTDVTLDADRINRNNPVPEPLPVLLLGWGLIVASQIKRPI